MKDNLRRFRLMSLFIDMGLFYSITVRQFGISLQGHDTPDTREKLKEFDFHPEVAMSHLLHVYRKNDIEIVLT